MHDRAGRRAQRVRAVLVALAVLAGALALGGCSSGGPGSTTTTSEPGY